MMRCFVVSKKKNFWKKKEGRLFPTYWKFFNVKTFVFTKIVEKGGIVFKKTGSPEI